MKLLLLIIALFCSTMLSAQSTSSSPESKRLWAAAKIYEEEGQLRYAVQELEKIIEKEDNDLVYKKIIDIYTTFGTRHDIAKARSYVKKLVKLYPNYEDEMIETQARLDVKERLWKKNFFDKLVGKWTGSRNDNFGTTYADFEVRKVGEDAWNVYVQDIQDIDGYTYKSTSSWKVANLNFLHWDEDDLVVTAYIKDVGSANDWFTTHHYDDNGKRTTAYVKISFAFSESAFNENGDLMISFAINFRGPYSPNWNQSDMILRKVK